MVISKKISMLLKIGVIATGLVFVACGKKDDDEEETTPSTGETAGTASVSKLTDINLSKALNFSLPSSVTGSGTTTLALLAGKSQEACLVRMGIKEAISTMKNLGSMFCHLEKEQDTIKENEPTRIDVTDTPDDSMAIKVDTSKKAEGTISIYFCEDAKEGKGESLELHQVIVINGAKDGKVKGYMFNKGIKASQGHAWAEKVEFDSGYTTEGQTLLTVNSRFSNSKDNGRFARQVILDIKKELSKLIYSKKGTFDGMSFAEVGAARIDKEYGMAILQNKSSNPQGGTFDFTRKAYFNASGEIVASTASAEFVDGKSLYVQDAMVPKFLPDDYEPDAAGFAGWDCATTATVKIDMKAEAKKAEHDTCEAGRDEGFSGENCWQGYSQGEDHQVDDSKRKDGKDMKGKID